MAGKITTLFLFFGAIGGFCGGAVADRLGGKNVISWSMFFSTPLLLAFLLNSGGLSYVFLAAAGLTLLSTLPVNVVMAQNLMPQSSSVVSSLMMGLAWGTGGMVVPIIGIIADVAGLTRALMAVSLLPDPGFRFGAVFAYTLYGIIHVFRGRQGFVGLQEHSGADCRVAPFVDYNEPAQLTITVIIVECDRGGSAQIDLANFI